MRRPAFVDVLDYPARMLVRSGFVKRSTNREASRNAPHGLMKEPGVARAEPSDKFVHAALEGLGIIEREDFLPAFTSKLRPPGPIEVRVKILLRNLCNRSIENLSPLIEAQIGWS